MSLFKKLKSLLNNVLNNVHKKHIPYTINEIEYKRMLELDSHIVKLDGTNGIGVAVHCLNKKNKWIDITDYSTW